MKRLWFLLPIASFVGCALVSRMFSPNPGEPAYRPEDLSDAAVRLPGAESMAAGIALTDLIGLVRSETAGGGGLESDGGVRDPDDGGTGEDGGWRYSDAFMARCLLDPSTYQVWVDLDRAKRRWKVIVFPEAECSLKFHGGAAEYEIDPDTFEILHRERME